MKSISSFALSKEIPLFVLALAILFPHALIARPPYDKRSGAYPNGSSGSNMQAVAARAANDVWVVGWSWTASPYTQWPVVEHWDGAQWNLIANPANVPQSRLLGVTVVAQNDVWMVGQTLDTDRTLAMHWNGTALSVVSTPSPTQNDQLNAVAAAASNDVWAVGSTGYTSSRATLIEHWDGTHWSVVYSSNGGYLDELLGVAVLPKGKSLHENCRCRNEVWAVGALYLNNLYSQVLVWDRLRWGVDPSSIQGIYGAEFLGVSALTQENVWAVGIDSGSFTCHWDGASWTKVPSPNPGSYGTALYAVAMIASNDVWAVGQTIYPNETVTLHWDGNSWTRVPSPSPSSTSSGNILYGVAAMSSKDVWAVGTGQAGLILRWNGNQWLVVPHPAGQ